MIRPLMLAATAAALVLGSAALAQQTTPASPTPTQDGGTLSQKSPQSMDKQKTSRRPTQRVQGGKLDSIASGLNACQLMAENERQACIDRVIRENGG